MRIAIIGRSEYLYESAQLLLQNNYSIPLIVTCKEAPEYKYTAADFELLAKKCGAQFINSAKINKPEIVEQMRRIGNIDLAVSINYAGIIEQEIINLFPLGILNAHGGDLPRYRGNACMAWAIINKENKVGLCIHKMIGGELDSGNIITKKYHDININSKVGELFNWMRTEIPPMMLESVKLLQKDPVFFLEAQSKNPKDALRTYPRLPEDGKIDWTKSNEEIVRLINASSAPFSGAFCTLDSHKMIIWDAEIFIDEEEYLAMPGQVASIDRHSGSMIVICGSGKIKINQVAYPDQRCAPADVIKSIRTRLK